IVFQLSRLYNRRKEKLASISFFIPVIYMERLQIMDKKFGENALILIWTVAVAATGGSLFYSEVMGYIPCQLCWIHRILMYPLVIIYGVAIWKYNIDIALPGLILSGIGMAVSAYHYLVQKVPFFQEAGGACSGDVPCNVIYVNYFGFITI